MTVEPFDAPEIPPLEGQLVVSSRVRIPMSEFAFQFSRSSGPGGQNVNKVNSKAQLRWKPRESPSLPPSIRERFLTKFGNRLTVEGELLIASQRYRDSPRNRDDCLEKLRAMLLEILKPPPVRRPTRPTRASKERRLDSKRRTSQRKQNRRGPQGDD